MASSHGIVYIAVDEKCKLYVLDGGFRSEVNWFVLLKINNREN